MKQFHTRGQVISSPVVADGQLYFGSSDHCPYALDPATGSQKWKFKYDGRITPKPAVSGCVVYCGSYDGNFYDVDAATVPMWWRFKSHGERRYTATHVHEASAGCR